MGFGRTIVADNSSELHLEVGDNAAFFPVAVSNWVRALLSAELACGFAAFQIGTSAAILGLGQGAFGFGRQRGAGLVCRF